MFDNIVLFTILAETKSFTGTAEQVFLSQSTLSKRIAELEDYLGTKLIVHSTRKFALTPEGEIIYQKFKHLRKYLNESIGFLQENKNTSSGELRISLATVFAYELISPYMDEFIDKYPGVNLSIIHQQEKPNLDKDGIDIAVSAHKVEHDDFDCIFLRREIGQLFCTPNYVTKYGIPRYIEELDNHRVIGIVDTISYQSPPFIKLTNRYSKSEYIVDNIKPRIKVNLASHMKQIGMHGNYIFGCWGCLCEDEIRNGKLIPVLPDYETGGSDFYLISRKRPSTIETYFIDFLYRCMNRSITIDKLYKYDDHS